MMDRDASKFGDYEGYEEMDEEMEIPEQSLDGNDPSDDFFDELERDITIAQMDYKPKKSIAYDWTGSQRKHGRLALETVDYLFKEMETDGLMGHQIDILRATMKYGIDKIQCNEPYRHSLKELWCLWHIESDDGEGSGDLEDILINILQKGVLTSNSSFVVNTPRQYNKEYIYKTLLDFLEEDKDKVIKTLSNIKYTWLSLIEDIDDNTYYACYRNQYYTLPELIHLLDVKLKQRRVHFYARGEPYTFQKLYDEMVSDDEGPWQQVVDFWEQMLEYNDIQELRERPKRDRSNDEEEQGRRKRK